MEKGLLFENPKNGNQIILYPDDFPDDPMFENITLNPGSWFYKGDPSQFEIREDVWILKPSDRKTTVGSSREINVP